MKQNRVFQHRHERICQSAFKCSYSCKRGLSDFILNIIGEQELETLRNQAYTEETTCSLTLFYHRSTARILIQRGLLTQLLYSTCIADMVLFLGNNKQDQFHNPTDIRDILTIHMNCLSVTLFEFSTESKRDSGITSQSLLRCTNTHYITSLSTDYSIW